MLTYDCFRLLTPASVWGQVCLSMSLTQHHHPWVTSQVVNVLTTHLVNSLHEASSICSVSNSGSGSAHFSPSSYLVHFVLKARHVVLCDKNWPWCEDSCYSGQEFCVFSAHCPSGVPPFARPLTLNWGSPEGSSEREGLCAHAGALWCAVRLEEGRLLCSLSYMPCRSWPASGAQAFTCLSSATHSVLGPACWLPAQPPSWTPPHVDYDIGNMYLLLLERWEDDGTPPQLLWGPDSFLPRRVGFCREKVLGMPQVLHFPSCSQGQDRSWPGRPSGLFSFQQFIKMTTPCFSQWRPQQRLFRASLSWLWLSRKTHLSRFLGTMCPDLPSPHSQEKSSAFSLSSLILLQGWEWWCTGSLQLRAPEFYLQWFWGLLSGYISFIKGAGDVPIFSTT